MSRKLPILILLSATLCLAFSCASAPKPIPADVSLSELVQRAQEATDKYDDATAIACYQAAMDHLFRLTLGYFSDKYFK